MEITVTGLDVTTPSMARVYDYWRGGKEHFAADRAQAAAVEALYPPGQGPRSLVPKNRAFLERAVSSAVHDGIGQVLDLGSGFPGPEPLHEVAKAARGTARVCYVDRDRVVVSHAKALTKGMAGVAAAHADLSIPAGVMADPAARPVISPARPVCVVFGLVLHFMDAAAARRVVEGWAEWLPSGSRFAVTAAHFDDEALFGRMRAVYGPARLFNHGEDELAEILRGLDLLGSGRIETARGWGPECVEQAGPARVLGCVARKP